MPATLSGGNQQKVIIAREFTHAQKLLIAAQPTRGLDVGSIQYIHRRIVEERDEGAAVLIVSTELDEVLALADRVAVMCRNRFVGILDRDRGRPPTGRPHDGGHPRRRAPPARGRADDPLLTDEGLL